MPSLAEATPNTTDATRGQRLADRVLRRKNELEDLRAQCGKHEMLLRQLIDMALATVYLAAGLALNARRELDAAAQLAPHDDTIVAMMRRAGSKT